MTLTEQDIDHRIDLILSEALPLGYLLDPGVRAVLKRGSTLRELVRADLVRKRDMSPIRG